MRRVNVTSCELDELLERGEFRYSALQLTEELGASVIGATVYEMRAGDRLGPYHYHHGVEEWMYVVSGAPILRDPDGERKLESGVLVTFGSGPRGAHTVHGPGRIVMFSAGARGWGEAFVTVYPDSEKIAAAPGVMFRRGDALHRPAEDASAPSESKDAARKPAFGRASPVVNVRSVVVERESRDGSPMPGMRLDPLLEAETWTATLYELAPGEATSPYHYAWCREEWALMLSGTPTLRHSDGADALGAGDIVCFPQGPTGAHQLLNDGDRVARLIIFSSPAGRPMSAFYPDDGTVLIRIPGHEEFLFRQADQIADYWDGEPGAGVG